MAKDLFRNRARSVRTFGRKVGTKAPVKRYLLVCEGSKTEPNYFEELKTTEGLTTADVQVCGEECGSDPLSIIAFGLERFNEELKVIPFDKVFCVFDRDKHPTFASALAKIKEMNRSGLPFEAVTSIPSFEFWILLHFRYSRNPYAAPAKQSVGALVLRDVQAVFPSYAKNANNLYVTLRSRLKDAIRNADAAIKDAERTGEYNPSTRIHTLVEKLHELARELRS